MPAAHATATRVGEPAGLAPRRFPGLLPRRLLRPRRPRWWQEAIIVVLGYVLYSLGRNAIPRHPAVAFAHGRDISSLQQRLHLDFELAFNHVVARHEWLAQVMDYDYATLHFLVTPAVLIWLFVRRPAIYRGARTVLVTATLACLACFYLYPTAPPRLLAHAGFVDTVLRFRTWGSLADPHVADHANQFAAMPSLHLAWALWCGVCLVRCASRQWLRVLGVAYPVWTAAVVLGTANHYLLDVLAGAAVLAVSFGVQYLLSGHGAFTAPPELGRAG